MVSRHLSVCLSDSFDFFCHNYMKLTYSLPGGKEVPICSKGIIPKFQMECMGYIKVAASRGFVATALPSCCIVLNCATRQDVFTSVRPKYADIVQKQLNIF